MRNLPRRSRLFACLMVAALGSVAVVADGAMRQALAQDTSIDDFHESLAAYGQWVPHPHWGEVWIPVNVPDDWAPYRYGHWVYTEEWGWYWVSDEDFGWITYHYGRWFPDPNLGWVWIPGTEWSPAWVSWRRGDDAVGWAPMLPDEVIDQYEERPEIWCFVRPHEIFTQRVAFVAFPRTQVNVFMRQTEVVNRTVFIQHGGGRAIANPGIPPSYIAAKIGHPVETVSVQPHVVRGTAGVADAVVGRTTRGVPIRETVRVQGAVIQPATSVPPPTRFHPGQANLGPDAPNALKRALPGSGPPATPGTQGNIRPHPQGTIEQQQGDRGGLANQGNVQHRQEDFRQPQGTIGTPQPHGNIRQQQEFNRPPPPPPPQVARPTPPPPPQGPAAPPQGTIGAPQPHGNVHQQQEFYRPSPSPQVSRPTPPSPPPAVRPAGPPPQAGKPPAQAGKRCEKLPNGQEVCR